MTTAGYLIFALAFFATCYSENSTTSTKYDVIVVGMGAAGCAAASQLARAGKHVLGIEAQDYVGGRVRTVRFGTGTVEIGGEWMHGTEDNRVYELGLQNNVTMLPQDLNNLKIYRSDGVPVIKEIKEVLEKGIEFMYLVTDKPGPLGELITKKLIEYMAENKPDLLKDKDLVTQMLNFLNFNVDAYEGSNDWNDVNSQSPYEDLGGHQHMSMRPGYEILFDILLNKYNGGPGLPTLEIKLKSPVESIEWQKEGGIHVRCRGGATFEADNIIVTVSLGVLKQKHSTMFVPTLPQEKQRAIETVAMGVIGKIILAFAQPLWEGKNYIYGFLWRGEDLTTVPAEDYWTTKIMGLSVPMGSNNTITVWTYGEVTKKVESLPEDEVKIKIMNLLRRFINKNIPEPIEMLRSTWWNNEFTRGTYTYDAVTADGTGENRAKLAVPLRSANGGQLLFAGEATHCTRYGTVHGATETGLREANRLLANKS